MVNKATLIDTLEKKIPKIVVGTCLDIRSYKRDRKILVVKQSDDELLVIEEGFSSRQYTIPITGLRKLMKVLVKHEFPRSNKIRIYTEENWTEEEVTRRMTI